ncbi:hypothetical protein LTR86_007178 [Recurvomyces mirabilis]|nr:hypothetical protein LTR86_007178 [Recurvomyces mirabilis]
MASDVPLTFTLPEGVVVWISRVIYTLQVISSPVTFYFRTACIFLAVSWLAVRAWQVLHTPLDDLASLLGFDIPLTPVVDLASIKADGCVLRWSLPEKQKQKSKLKYEIHVNGNAVEHVSIHETAVTITNLLPNTYYVLRVALVNEQELASRSEPIRFRTKSAATQDFFVPQHSADTGDDADQDGAGSTMERTPRVRVFRGLKDIAPAPASIDNGPASMERQGSSNGLGPKRSVTGRRTSPAALGLDVEVEPHIEETEPAEGHESIQQLTTKLEAIRKEITSAEQSTEKEDEEDSQLKQELHDEREELKTHVAEKTEASKTLKRELNLLMQHNGTAQSERSKQERFLQQKKQERQKQKEDMLKWEQETASFQKDAEKLEASKAAHKRGVEEEKNALRLKQADEAGAMKSLEDRVKETNSAIKKLERDIKNTSPDGTSHNEESNLVQQMQQDAEEERQWQNHKAGLIQQYGSIHQKLEASKRFHDEQMLYLDSIRRQRRREDDLITAAQSHFGSPPPPPPPPPPAERMIHRGDSQRSRRAASGQSSNNSPRMGHFPLVSSGSSSSPFATGLASISPASNFHSAPYFNPHNGMTLRTDQPTDYIGMTDEEREKLTGGAPMSPGAGAELLPADLFSGDDGGRDQGFLPGLGALPGLPSLPGGPSMSQPGADRERDYPYPGPASPASASSRSPSVFASPRASQNNLHLGSPENTFPSMDPDRRSIRSTRSTRAGTAGALGGIPAASSRFSGLFGIKQRTKTASAGSSGGDLDGLALGKAQSHSMPRQDQSIPGLLESQIRKRNSSISGITGPNSELSGLGDGSSDVLMGEQQVQNQVSRFRAFGMGRIFGGDKEGAGGSGGGSGTTTGGWPSGFSRRPGSPRPGSTHSNELPRPSVDSSRWTDLVAGGGGARSSPLSFNTSWMLPSTSSSSGSRLYGSRHPSRRPSVQYAASGPPEDIMEDEDSDALSQPDVHGGSRQAPPLAPIGTRPKGKQRDEGEGDEGGAGSAAAAAARLNPAAKDFKSFLGIKSKDKEKEKDKARSASTATMAGTSNTVPVPSSSLVTPTSYASTHRDRDNMDYDTGSPPESRKSRSDARSMTTTTTESSLADSNELAGGHLSDLARTPSYSNASDGVAPSPLIGSGSLGKESFMQKISRKSSSGKFSLPTFKREKSRLVVDAASSSASGVGNSPNLNGNGGLTTPSAELHEEDDGVMGASIGSLRDSREGRESKEVARGSVRSWSHVLKLAKGSGGKGKEKGDGTPSLSGLSLASGTEDGESVGGVEGEEER